MWRMCKVFERGDRLRKVCIGMGVGERMGWAQGRMQLGVLEGSFRWVDVSMRYVGSKNRADGGRDRSLYVWVELSGVG
jgi:hypothetical protein